MSNTVVSRIAGPFVLATGLLLTAAELILLGGYDATDLQATVHNPAYLVGDFIYFVAFGCLLITLATIHAWQAHEAGVLGLVGVGAAMIGTLFLGGDLWFETFAVPWLGDVAPDAFGKASGLLMIGGFSSYVLFAAGWALFGIASLRARVIPMGIALAIIAGGVIGFQALLPPFGIPLGLAIASLGVWMTRASITAANRSEPVGASLA